MQNRRVNEEDVVYFYRLFLQRELNEFEWDSWRALSAAQEVSLQWLIASILYSQEFSSLREGTEPAQIIDLPEMKICIRPNDAAVGANIAYYKTWEPHVTQALQSLLTPGAVFIDIGANIGYFSLLAAPLVGAQGAVMAFEPNPDNCFLLGQSIQANGYTNIHVYPYAVTERTETVGLITPFPISNGRIVSLLETGGENGEVSHIIESVALDEFMGNMEHIDVIKMDIEGAEPLALLGMRQVLQSHRPILITEFNPIAIEAWSHVSSESYLDQLIELGFELTIIDRVIGLGHIPQSKEAILEACRHSSSQYVELLAYPRS